MSAFEKQLQRQWRTEGGSLIVFHKDAKALAAKKERHEKRALGDAQRKQVKVLTKQWFQDRPGRHVEAIPKFVRDEMSIITQSGGTEGLEIITLRLEWHSLSKEEKKQTCLSWVQKEVCLKWHDIITASRDTITDEELCKLSPEELTQIQRVEEEEEWARVSKWEKIWERKEALGGIECPCRRSERDWFASWSPILSVRIEEHEMWDQGLLVEQQIQAQREHDQVQRDLESFEERRRRSQIDRIERSKRFLSSLATLTGSDLPDEDCALCLEPLSSEDSIALPCDKRHCFHRDCVKHCFGKAMFLCSVCRKDHSSTIDLFH